MLRFGELDKAITAYTCRDVKEAIPVDYYRQVIKTTIQMQNEGKHWDIQQSAAMLLYFAFDDGHLHPSQLTASGLDALVYAEKLLQETDMVKYQAEAMNELPVKLVKGI